MEKSFVIVPMDYVSAFSDELLVSAYVMSVRYFICSTLDKVYVSPIEIANDLFGKIDKEHVARVETQFVRLKNYGVLEKLRGHDTYYITSESLRRTKSDRFVKLYYDDILKIVNSSRKNKISLVAHYCRIISTLFYETDEEIYTNKFGHVSIDFFMKKYKLSRNTVLRMHKALHELELIAWANPGKTGDEYSTNYYCRFKDRGLLKQYLKMRSFNNMKYANKCRSIKQQLNNIEKYDEEKKAQIIEDVIAENNRRKWDGEDYISISKIDGASEIEEELPFN